MADTLPDSLVDRLHAIVLAEGPVDQAGEIARLCAQHPEFAGAIGTHVERLRAVEAALRGGISAGDPGAAPGTSSNEAHPEWIGPYRVLGVLGTGGMGMVYAAERKQPFHKRVAIKVIRPGMDSGAMLARFELERQALALMDHPNLAKVLDAGTAAGQPYFVMEMVRGVPLTRYCEQNRLTLTARIELFLQVCQGVQHAHHKGIIHRDLKPSNVLVEMADGRPMARVIDFGLARATHRITEQTVYTEPGQVLGTLAYMSPEQVDAASMDVDTRTDVWSLGVMLYELLTGHLPFGTPDGSTLGQLSLQRAILSDAPKRPSAMIATRQDSKTIALARQTVSQSLARSLRGDLDWITLKALEKDRTRRYQTPLELAADLRRFLDDEPVSAGPPSLLYRTAKLLRRYRAQVLGAGVLLALIVVSAAIGWVLYGRAESARQREADAREALRTAKQAVELERDNHRRAREDLERLAARLRLQQLAVAAEDLWPATQPTLPALEHWLGEFQELSRSIPEFESTVQRLRADADARKLDDKWSFPTLARQMLHDASSELLAELRAAGAPGGLRDRVATRRHRALQAAQRETDPAHAAEWLDALRQIARHPAYGPATMSRPQTGLLPLGRDPTSDLWEFAVIDSGRVPSRGPNGHLDLAADAAIVLVLIPGGRTWLGAQRVDPSAATFDPHAQDNEAPYEADVAPFFLAKHEVSRAQWQALAEGDSPSRWAQEQPQMAVPDHPVEMVSWTRADRVLRNHGLRLPSETEWEYACRARTRSPWWTGDDRRSLLVEPRAVNVADASAKSLGFPWTGVAAWPEYDDGEPVVASVHAFAANRFGLHHMLGNVAEWCADSYTPRRSEAPPSAQQPAQHAVRGGNFARSVLEARCAWRVSLPPDAVFDSVGLRAARTIEAE